MKKYILFILLGFIFVTSTVSATTHLCMGCETKSDTVCTMLLPTTEKEACHNSPKPAEKECCNNSNTEDCETCSELETPSSSEKVSKTTLNLKIQLDSIMSQVNTSFEKETLSTKAYHQIELREAPPSFALILLKSVRLLC
jgi:hypothetical protein